MTVTIVEEARPVTCRTAITGGVDTHADTHVAAALDPVGGLLGAGEFPATAAGYARLLGWLGGFGTVALAGIEGTGSYGAGAWPWPTRDAGSVVWVLLEVWEQLELQVPGPTEIPQVRRLRWRPHRKPTDMTAFHGTSRHHC